MNPVIAKKVQNAKIKLFKKSDGLNFFGTCSYMFDWDIHPMKGKSAEGYVLFDKDTWKIEDGTIHINKDMVMLDNYTHIHLAYIVCHELLHILSKHGVRKGQRNHDIWCVACDHCVERDLKELATSIVPYDNDYHMFDELDKLKHKCTVEFAYDWIIKQIKLGKIKIVRVPGGMIGVNGPEGTFEVNPQVGGVDQNKIKSTDLKAIQTNEKIVAEARALHQTMKAKGNQSGNLTSYLDKILAVKIPWEVLLEKAIKTNVILKPNERTWRNPNKYFRALGYILPGTSSTEDREGVGVIIYATDSSGSMSDEELKKCSSVTDQSFQFFREIWLYVHDMIVHQKKVFTKDDRHQFIGFLKNEGYQGRGGTSHEDVFQKIQKQAWENDLVKNDLSMVICLTDGCSDIETQLKKKQYKWLKNVPTIFVISGNYKLSIEHENVTVIYMDGRDQDDD